MKNCWNTIYKLGYSKIGIEKKLGVKPTRKEILTLIKERNKVAVSNGRIRGWTK